MRETITARAERDSRAFENSGEFGDYKPRGNSSSRSSNTTTRTYNKGRGRCHGRGFCCTRAEEACYPSSETRPNRLYIRSQGLLRGLYPCPHLDLVSTNRSNKHGMIRLFEWGKCQSRGRCVSNVEGELGGRYASGGPMMTPKRASISKSSRMGFPADMYIDEKSHNTASRLILRRGGHNSRKRNNEEAGGEPGAHIREDSDTAPTKWGRGPILTGEQSRRVTNGSREASTK